MSDSDGTITWILRSTNAPGANHKNRSSSKHIKFMAPSGKKSLNYYTLELTILSKIISTLHCEDHSEESTSFLDSKIAPIKCESSNPPYFHSLYNLLRPIRKLEVPFFIISVLVDRIFEFASFKPSKSNMGGKSSSIENKDKAKYQNAIEKLVEFKYFSFLI